VLDEICAAYGHNLVDRAAVDDFLRNLPADAEVVLTGRNPPQVFLDHADYITEMKKIRHPFDNGIAARKGVEF
jgi:cob(I)alamin adenosyltransferase